MPNTKNGRWMICPDCKKNISSIESIYFSPNSIPMIKLKCKCTVNTTNMSLSDYISSLNKSPFNNISCRNHPGNDCDNYCINCKFWLCQKCLEAHTKEHMIYHTENVSCRMCVNHHKDTDFYCKTCDNEVCSKCVSEEHSGHVIINLGNYWSVVKDKMKFKNINEVNECFKKIKTNIFKEREEIITTINRFIILFEKMKYDIEKLYSELQRNNENVIQIIKIAVDNFNTTKGKVSYNIIKNAEIFEFNSDDSNKKKEKREQEQKKLIDIENHVNLVYDKYKSLTSEFFKNNLIINNFLFINNSNNSSTNTHVSVESGIVFTQPKQHGYYSILFKIRYNPKKSFYKRCKITLESDVINNLIQLSNGNIASCSNDSNIQIWSLSSEQCIHILKGHTAKVNQINQLKDGKLISCSEDCTIKVWSLATMKYESELLGHEESVLTVIQMNNGNIVSGSYDHYIKIWNLETLHCIQTLRGHTETVYRVIEVKNCLVSSSYDNTIKIWDPTKGTETSTLSGHKSYVWDICKVVIKKDKRDMIASGSTDKTIKVWDIVNSQCLFTLEEHGFTVISLIQANNGDLISGSYDTTIKIWDLETRICKTTLIGHENAVWTLLQTADGKLISGSWDKTIKVWD